MSAPRLARHNMYCDSCDLLVVCSCTIWIGVIRVPFAGSHPRFIATCQIIYYYSEYKCCKSPNSYPNLYPSVFEGMHIRTLSCIFVLWFSHHPLLPLTTYSIALMFPVASKNCDICHLIPDPLTRTVYI